MRIVSSLSLLLFIFSCTAPKGGDNVNTEETNVIQELPELRSLVPQGPAPGDTLEGRLLALQYCQGCHLFPDPKMLPKHIWTQEVLPKMAMFLGVHHTTDQASLRMLEQDAQARKAIEEAGVIPKKALISLPEWLSIMDYYEEQAPESVTVGDRVRPEEQQQFTVKKSAYASSFPMTTYLKINEKASEIWLGDMTDGSLVFLDKEGDRKHQVPLGSPPVHVSASKDGNSLKVTLIGEVFPSDKPRGEVISLEKKGERYAFGGKRLLRRLLRPTYSSYADFNNDGLEDILPSEFGNMSGHLAWYEATADGAYQKHMIQQNPGTMNTYVHDFNNDGFLDVAALKGQGKEGIYIYYNRGDGSFAESYEIQVPSSYGSSYFELADFNGDGMLDVLATNGDNGDYPPFMKPYHGVRIYLNDGNNHFEEAWFYPLNGAFKAVARDFDEDGDLDIAAISFFPDYENSPWESFVYLEQVSELSFKASTTDLGLAGRWLTMDAGDLDGDGDIDLALGAFMQGPSQVPERFTSAWGREGKSVLLFYNSLK